MFVVGEWEGVLENFRLEEEEEPFDLKFFYFLFCGCRLKWYTLRQASFYFFFSTEKFTRLFLFKKVKPLPTRKNKPKLLTFDNVSLATVFSLKPVGRSRMMTAIEFSRQNDAGAPAHTTESLVFVVVPVLESKGL